MCEIVQCAVTELFCGIVYRLLQLRDITLGLNWTGEFMSNKSEGMRLWAQDPLPMHHERERDAL